MSLLILIPITIISASLTALSAIQIARGNFAGFKPLFYGFGIPYGAWIWGDLFIFAILWTIIPPFIYLLKLNHHYFWIAFFSFWLIRSAGEAFYWFLAQFHPDSIPWPQYFPKVLILKNLTPKDWWVLNQLVFQVIAIFCLFGIIYQLSQIIKK